MKRITAKLGNMKKAQDFVVYPMAEDDKVITVQSARSIGHFDWRTGKGLLNTNGKYFVHLPHGKPYEFPREFITACLEAALIKGADGSIKLTDLLKQK